MKRLVALLISVVLLCGMVSSLAEGTFDMSTYTSSNVFTVDEDTENNIAFIESGMGSADLAFNHKYESDDYYSIMRNDIIVINQSSDSRYPVMRTWIYYRGTKQLDIHSVSFILEGKEFVISDVADKDRVTKVDDNCTEETLLIRYGYENWDFFAEIASTAMSYYGAWVEDKETPVPEIKVVLHGTEDVETTVSGNFLLDMGVFVLSMIANDTIGLLIDVDGNPCKVIE